MGLAFAPLIGSYINLFFGWRGNFVALLILGIICFLIGIKYLPQSKKNHSVTLSMKEYLVIFKSKKAFYYIITIMFMIQAYWVFIAISPILYMKDLGVSLEKFGLYQGTMAAAFSIVNFGSGYLLNKFGQKKCFYFSIFILIIFVFATIVLIFVETKNPLLITLVTVLAAIGMMIPCNILWPLSLEAVPHSLKVGLLRY
ncbi:MAG: MFS transporter [Rickettsia endosymbiont of Bryobia graminum]|nr:MFS transporter [Rickettsia endosymbiont of Bryobia graminum]